MTIEFSPTNKPVSFFEYLAKEKLYYKTETVENFLLSMKVKPFIILSGGTGTGKTKLAQMYGKFISSEKNEYNITETEVTLTKADTNNGFTVKADDFFDKLPFDGRRANGIYKARLGNLEADCTISLAPRLWYRPNVEKFKDEINSLKKQGKSKEILKIYIPIKIASGDHYEIVPVGSNWTESRFILGYRNVLTKEYSSPNSLKLIIKANKNPSEPYMLILDEMNLSHVERYFSDILSSMESGEEIYLDSDGTDVPNSIEFGNNLIIVGTVNVDETTYVFSPKVLDRANVIEFDNIAVADYFEGSVDIKPPSGNVDYLQNCMNGFDIRKMNAKEIIDYFNETITNKPIISELTKDLGMIQETMDSIHLSFGFRTIDEILRFMYAAWVYTGKGEYNKWKRFFDAQIKQKILPKIKGNLSIKDGLEKLYSLCSEKGYETSASKLKTMINTLDKQRYVSFNC